MKDRIIIETESSGKKWYYVQQKFLFFFWISLAEVRDMSMSIRSVGFSTLNEAEEYLQYNVDNDYQKQQGKIIKREIYKKQIR